MLVFIFGWDFSFLGRKDKKSTPKEIGKPANEAESGKPHFF